MEGARTDQEQPHDQDTQVADDRNDESGANVSLQSDHTGVSRYRPSGSAAYIIPADWYAAFFIGFADIRQSRLEPIRRQRRVARRILDIAMPQGLGYGQDRTYRQSLSRSLDTPAWRLEVRRLPADADYRRLTSIAQESKQRECQRPIRTLRYLALIDGWFPMLNAVRSGGRPRYQFINNLPRKLDSGRK
jgi:hypothetical protein